MRRLLGALAVLTLALTASAGAQPAAQLTTVRIAMPPVDAASQAYYAQAKGFFTKVGLKVEITTVSGGAAVAAAVAGGAVDIGQSNLSSLCSAHERGIPFVAIAGANQFVAKQHQSALVVAPNASYRDARDLNGKTIGVSGLKNITEIAFDQWMEKNGGNYASAKVLEVPFSSMAEAVASGRVDAAMMTEPELSGALEKKRVRVLAAPFEAIGSEFVVGVWFATAPYVKAHPDIVHAYAQAMALAADWANRNQSESAKILESSTGITLGAHAARVLFANHLDVKEMQPVIDASAKYGALKSTFPAQQLLAAE
jgi:NitT/TauT family transport system substrate-binding protein